MFTAHLDSVRIRHIVKHTLFAEYGAAAQVVQDQIFVARLDILWEVSAVLAASGLKDDPTLAFEEYVEVVIHLSVPDHLVSLRIRVLLEVRVFVLHGLSPDLSEHGPMPQKKVDLCIADGQLSLCDDLLPYGSVNLNDLSGVVLRVFRLAVASIAL